MYELLSDAVGKENFDMKIYMSTIQMHLLHSPKNATASAISTGSPNRRNAMLAVTMSLTFSGTVSVIGVLMKPEQITIIIAVNSRFSLLDKLHNTAKVFTFNSNTHQE